MPVYREQLWMVAVFAQLWPSPTFYLPQRRVGELGAWEANAGNGGPNLPASSQSVATRLCPSDPKTFLVKLLKLVPSGQCDLHGTARTGFCKKILLNSNTSIKNLLRSYETKSFQIQRLVDR